MATTRAIALEVPEVMTTSEVARYLRVHPTTVYRHLAESDQEKRIPHFRIGSDHRFRKSSIDKWLERLEESAD